MEARRNIPEVTQTSAMDCGPAVLASMLAGFGASVSFPRLREACQTDVDGTSIDTLEELAVRFGLCAEQVVLPNDCVFDAAGSNLPCIAVVTLPNGLTHFVVVWRERYGFVQIMDPARGRSWMHTSRFLDQLYQHRVVVPAEGWLEYARSDEFRTSIAQRLQAIGVDARTAGAFLEEAYSPDTWQAVARLDAAVRMCTSIRRAERRASGNAQALVRTLLDSPELLTDDYFQVRLHGDGLALTGAVIVRVSGHPGHADPDDPIISHTRDSSAQSVFQRLRVLYQELGMKRVAFGLAAVSALVGLVTFVEALIFRYLIGAQPPADSGMLALIAFIVITPLAAAVTLEAAGLKLSQVLGRNLATNIHARLLRKLPRMADGYFSSRLVSDLAERSHAVSQVRELPEVARQIMVVVSRIALLLVGLVWLLPGQLLLIVAAGAIALLAPLAIFPTLVERDLRARTHLGALSRFYLDSLRGSDVIRAHGADRSIEHEQESLLLNWMRAISEQQRPSLIFESGQIVLLGGFSVALVMLALDSSMSLGSILLVAYWSLFVPILSRQLTQALKQLPAYENVARRVLELLDAPEENVDSAAAAPSEPAPGVHLRFEAATVMRGDLPLIDSVSVDIRPGEQVAIVGASGSGKSSFLATILGWNLLDDGRLLVDGEPLTPGAACALREQTVVIDPDLYLWNRSLFDNICYGREQTGGEAYEQALSDSEVIADLARMDEGLATIAGENGSRLSGGEGQRLRVARGLARTDRRLVLLDEPFTGMDSTQRRRLQRTVVQRWPGATLLLVSHNIRETAGFDRVLVFDQGRVVEDGNPATLLTAPDSVYARLFEQEAAFEQHLARSGLWRHHRLHDGEVLEA
ncbi:MAG: cysteine peptidase family C39 domain-containing protein [Pseudomonadales bacterium]